MVSMRRALLLAAVLLLGVEGAAGAGETKLADPVNPRNSRFSGAVVNYLSATPRVRASANDNRYAWKDGTAIEWRSPRPLELRPSRGAFSPADLRRYDEATHADWSIDGVAARPRGGLESVTTSNGITLVGGGAPWVPWTARAGRHLVSVVTSDDRCVVSTDALRVLLLVEEQALEEGDRRFGSFARRFRKSLDDLNALLASSVSAHAPDGVVDRFRIDDALVYSAADGPVPVVWINHPEADVAVACETDRKFVGPPPVGAAVAFAGGRRDRGLDLWTETAEQTMWRDLLRLRGVPDFARYAAAKGALPGRAHLGLPLPHRFSADLMASPDQTPKFTELTALLVNSNTGLSIIGDPDNSNDIRFARTWRWIPPRIDVVLNDGAAPAAGAAVRWWRSLPMKGLPESMPQGVAEGRAPDGEATADATGTVPIVGDVLASNAPDALRSLWVLVEVERAGAKRFEIIYGLDLNLAYARGETSVATFQWDISSMLVPGAKPPADR
jgi:hypothetical protein